MLMFDSSEWKELLGLVKFQLFFHEIDFLKMPFSLKAVKVHLSFNLNEPLFHMFLHFFEMLNLKIVFILQILVHIFDILSLTKGKHTSISSCLYSFFKIASS